MEQYKREVVLKFGCKTQQEDFLTWFKDEGERQMREYLVSMRVDDFVILEIDESDDMCVEVNLGDGTSDWSGI